MGQEIEQSHYRKQDFTSFEARLREETEALADYFAQNKLSEKSCVAGLELEAWLVDRDCQPLPENQRFLERLQNDLVVPELARFNVELNSEPHPLHQRVFHRMQSELEKTWKQCQKAAKAQKAALLMIGILPTVQEQQLVLDNISEMRRYRALNEQLMRLRQGMPLRLEIQGREHLKIYHDNVMLEAAATSFQLHLQMPQEQARRAYNASIVASAPIVAVGANSPYLFGYDLWDETRISLFEQAISVNSEDICSIPRVTFGRGYAQDSLMECFVENLESYPVLLPEALDPDVSRFSHLRLHNGTIWRWNRPLVGFDADGRPHLRIEHRVLPAGPTVVDTIANAAFYFGLVCAMSQAPEAPETQLNFAQARANFYAAAQRGLEATVQWLSGEKVDIQTLVLDDLLPLARTGLEQQDILRKDIDFYLGIITERVATRQNGSAWQRAYVARHGPDMAALSLAYQKNQRRGKPVHKWKV